MKTIYLDVLIVLNIYVNFFLLRATARFTHFPLKIIRCIISSFAGSLFSLTILIPKSNFILTVVIKLIAAVIITAIAFGIRDRRNFLRLLIYFYIINFVFAGVVGLLYNTFSPSFMTFNNSYFYVDFSLVSLVVFTAAAYFIVTVVRRIMDKGADSSKKYSITLKFRQTTVKLDAVADTGNSLTDSFTGIPVIVCPQEKLGINIDFNDAEKLYTEYKMRMIPYSTIGNTGLIPVFSPEEAVISDEENKKLYKVHALVGVINKDTPAIFNPEMLS